VIAARAGLAALALACAGAAGGAELRPWTGTQPPPFALEDLAGRTHRLADYRGQVVLVNFWATWCGPCKIEMPHLNRLYDKYRGAGFVLLGVNIDDQPEQALALARRMGLHFPVLLDTGREVSRRYALDSMPATVLIDRDGKVRHVHRGYREGMEETYERQIRELVKE